MKIDGKTKLCGLIGCPVEHTLSPIIHNTLAEKTGENLVYVPFHVERGDVEAAIKGAYALSVMGMNVTVPHKSAVLPYLRGIDPLAEKIGAVNTLVRTDGGYKGCNTDMTGLLRAMHSDGIVIKDREAILLGAGGAARAVAFLLVSEGVKKVWLLNRSVDKAQAVADEINNALEDTENKRVEALALSDYRLLHCTTSVGNHTGTNNAEAINTGTNHTGTNNAEINNADKDCDQKKYLCIQATSVGLHPDSDRAVIEDSAFYEMIDEAVDLIYKPAETKFMRLCRQAGAKAYNGLKMLLYQGIIAYELWNDIKVDEETAQEIYQLMKDATKIET